MKRHSVKCRGNPCLILVAFLATFLTGSLNAQDSNRLLTVRVITVAGGKTAEFVDLQRELTAAQKQAGSPGRWVWQEVRGNSNTFHVVTYSDNYAAFDEPSESVLGKAGGATWVSRISATVQSREVMTLRWPSDLEIKPEEGVEPNLLVLWKRKIAQGKSGAYRKWLVDKLMPALKKVGVTGYSVGRVDSGGNTNTWISARRLSSWSNLDEPGPFADLSAEERESLFADLEGLTVDTEKFILRYRADLSHDGP